MTALGNSFRDSGYSLTELIRTIANSQVYQLSSLPSERNVADSRYYSRHYRHRLRAEVLLDAFTQISGVPQSFAAMPPDSSARQIWTHRTESLFLDTFGRPDPNQDPPCERTSDSTVVQSLHLMNSEELHSHLTSDNGFAAQLAKTEQTPVRDCPNNLPASLCSQSDSRGICICRKSADRGRCKSPYGDRRPDVGHV